MIQVKLKICSVCGIPSKLWKSNPKLCKSCAGKAGNKDPDKSVAKNKPKTAEDIQKQNSRNVFFAEQSLQVPERCENCGSLLKAYDLDRKRFVTAHILPKSKFDTIQIHPMNRLFLGSSVFSDCGCHGDYDNGDAESRKKMFCYQLAIERVQSFKHLILPDQHGFAEKYLGIKL